jgi:hypothetical protein
MSGRSGVLCALVVVTACGHPARPGPPPSNRPNTPPPPPVAPAGEAVLAWPVARFTPVQIAEVKSCDTEKLASTRYPKTMPPAAMPAAFTPTTPCDQATLAAACGARVGDEEEVPAPCVTAYRAAVKANPAFAFARGLIGAYFGKVAIVAAPPATRRPLASVVFQYTWGGLGDPVEWTITATDLATKPAIAVTGKNAKKAAWSPAVAADIAALAPALTSFLPIPKPLNAVDCTDNYPEWTATFTFDDGTKLELTTNRSNLLGLGGPWQTTIAGVTYLQLGPDLVRALVKLIKTLDLPIGEPMGAMCRGYDLQREVFGG